MKKSKKTKIEGPKFTWTWETKDFNGKELGYKMIQFHGPGIGDTSLFMNLSESHADMMLLYFSKIYQQAIQDAERGRVSNCTYCAGNIRICTENNRGWKIMRVEPPINAHCAKKD